jgi:hypothetical protein
MSSKRAKLKKLKESFPCASCGGELGNAAGVKRSSSARDERLLGFYQWGLVGADLMEFVMSLPVIYAARVDAEKAKGNRRSLRWREIAEIAIDAAAEFKRERGLL